MINDERLEKILNEFFEREDGDQTPDPEEIVARHPELKDKLGPHLKALEALDQALAADGGLPREPLKTIGEYRIIREVGRGGMGVVYEAEQPSMSRRVALKLLAPVFTESTQAIKRFQREAKAAGSLHHTNIVQAHTMGEHEGYWYYTMELVEGGSLSQMIEEIGKEKHEVNYGRSRFLKVAEIFAGVADALNAAHEAGIIHRDIKPGNLLLDANGKTLKIVDFGMARLDEAPSLTLSGDILGTPVYMSPEQANAKLSDIDHRTDIYSLGATLYEVLTLKPPFKGKSALAIRSQIISRDPPPPRQLNRSIPRDMSVICTKAMEKDRKDRYQTAKEMGRDLLRFVEGMPIRAKPVGLIGRSWRKVKRNKVRSSLIAAVIVLIAAVCFFAIRAAYEAKQNRNLEYLRLIGLCKEAFGKSVSHVGTPNVHSPAIKHLLTNQYLDEAIELAPRRLEAYWLRALAPGSTKEQRLNDIDQAAQHGLPENTAQLLRAHVMIKLKATGTVDVTKWMEIAYSFEPGTALEYYLKAEALRDSGKNDEVLKLLDQAIENSKPSSMIHFLARRQRGVLHLEVNNHKRALDDLLAVRGLGDRTPETMIGIARIWKVLGKDEAAEEVFDDTLQETRTTGSWNAWYRLCLVCESAGVKTWIERAADDAIEVLVDQCERQPEWRPHGETLRARILSIRGDYAEAIQAYTDAIESLTQRDGTPAEGNETCDCLLRAYISRGVWRSNHSKDHEGALRDYDLALKIAPYCATAHSNKAKEFRALGRNDEAVKAYRNAIKADPYYLAAHVNLASFLCDNLARYEEALDAIESAHALAPHVWQVQNNRAAILGHLERHDEAIDAWRQVLKLAPLSPGGTQALRELPYSLWYTQQFEETLEEAERAVKLEPHNPDYLSMRALALASLGDFGCAHEDIKKIHSSGPCSGEALRILKEALTWYLCNYDEALKVAEEHFKAKEKTNMNDEIELAYYKVYCLRGLDLEEEAQKEAARWALKTRSNPEIRPSDKMAYLFAVTGDPVQAEAILDSLGEPSYAIQIDRRARVYAVIGDDERAIEMLERAAELGLRYPPQSGLGPDFEYLEDDPRYQAVLAKIHGVLGQQVVGSEK
jgi:serine/threonine protein kinase/tetratricopeptide (TPR) repeat protein